MVNENENTTSAHDAELKEALTALKNGNGMDFYVLGFAIETNDKGATVKKIAAEISEVLAKYEYDHTGTNKTDTVVRAGRVPSIVYAMVGGVPGIMSKAARDIKAECDKKDDADEE
jgi:hypothetical protein